MRVPRARHEGRVSNRLASQGNASEPRTGAVKQRRPLQPAPDWLRNGGAAGTLINSINWGRTPLGAVVNWPPSLKTSLALCLASRLPLAISWGPDRVALYNDAFCPLLGEKHPGSMGQPGRECWTGNWHFMAPMLERVLHRNEAVSSDDQSFPRHRQGKTEECYFRFECSPISAESERAGVFCAATETTDQVLRERRAGTLRNLTAIASSAKNGNEVCEAVAAVLNSNRADVPFALIYIRSDNGTRLALAGAVGLEAGTPTAPAVVALDVESSASAAEGWPLAAVAQGFGSILLTDLPARFGALPGGPWPESPHQALVLPIVPRGQDRPSGVFVAGVSPRRVLDESYREFLNLVAATIAPLRQSEDAVGLTGDFETAQDDAALVNARLAAIVDSCDDAIVGKTLDGIITSWNAGAQRIFGYDQDEAIGQHITLIVPVERHAEEGEVLARLRRGERIDHFETVRQTKDGRRIDVSLTVSPIRNAKGRIVGASKVARDITERRVAEDILREGVQVRETLSRIGASLAAELDPDKLIQAVTDAATTFTSAECGAFVYNTADDSGEAHQLFTFSGAKKEAFADFSSARSPESSDPAVRDDNIVRLDDASKDPRYGGTVLPFITTQGELVVRSYMVVPVVSPTRGVLGGLFFGHRRAGMFLPKHEQIAAGIASWAALFLDNARLYKSAQDANRTKDEFLATLSHELRNPLNAMLGWAQVLRSGTLPLETQRRGLDSLERNAKAQAQLIEDLLDISRVVLGKLQIRADEVDLTSVVLSALDTIRPTASTKGVTVKTHVDPDAQIVVTGDADRLRQIIWNLLSNAVKFTTKSGNVDIELRRVDSTVEIVVADTGQGIAGDFLPHVFDRFRQEDGGVTRRHGGLGLGLALVRQLAEAHGGSARAASPGLGRGATFTVQLPIRAIRSRSESAADPGLTQGAGLAGLRLLVVDDQADARDLLRVVLQSQGAEVTTVDSAGAALHILSSEPVDVLIADIGMPEQDGYSLIQAVRALDSPRTRQTPAIAVTAYASGRERAKALDAGYGWHLAKPVDPYQLIAVVSTAAHPSRAEETSRGGRDGEVWKVRVEDRRVSYAPTKEGHAQKRLRSKGEEPQTSDCHWSQRSEEKGRESAAARDVAQEVG
jgi:PAS domain S-box-containing protein